MQLHRTSYDLKEIGFGVINSDFSMRDSFEGRVLLEKEERTEPLLGLFLLELQFSLDANPTDSNQVSCQTTWQTDSQVRWASHQALRS